MVNITSKKLITSLIFGVGFSSAVTYAVDEGGPVGIAGKNNWLFYRFDYSTVADFKTTDMTLDLIKRFNKVAAANGITLVMVFPPLKMRVYSEFLPPSVKMNSGMMDQPDRALKALRANQVYVADINTPFMKDVNRNGQYPLFLKLDTHWSPSGVLLASEAVKVTVDSTPSLKKALDATPSATYTLEISKEKKTRNSHDLTMELPPSPQGQESFPPEVSLNFKVTRVPSQNGDQRGSGVALLGTSNSRPWTGFADALRYALQRDIYVSTANGDRGSWWGMQSYLRDDSFQISRPKILIWEMPERDLRAPPNYQYRSNGYLIDNTEWLLQVSAMLQANCKPSSVTAKLGSVGLAASSANQKTGGVAARVTSEADFIEVNFNDAMGKMDYLTARISSPGTKTVILEASGSDVPTRRFTADVATDAAEHVFKYSLPSNGKGYTKVRIYPGKTSGFSLRELQVCRQPDDLLN